MNPESHPREWKPLLANDEQDEPRHVIDVISQTLAGDPRMWNLPVPNRWMSTPEEKRNPNPGLSGGLAGISLFWAYKYLAFGEKSDLEVASALLEQAFDITSEGTSSISFFDGFPGVAWAAQHFQQVVYGEVDDSMLEDVDQILCRHIGILGKGTDYDLVSGLVGMGAYLRDRLPSPEAVEGLSSIVDLLDEMAEEREPGLAWRTEREKVPQRQMADAPFGYFNLGVAHGSPGVVGLLASLIGTEINQAKVGRLLDGAVNWILAQRLPRADPSLMPYNIPLTEGNINSSRLAWCYGDPGVALVLWEAAKALRSTELEKAALDMADSMVAIPPEQAKINDTSVCHGSAGMAHICNRLYQATGRESYAVAARYWLRDTLDKRVPDQGLCGYMSFSPAILEGVDWVADPGILTGVVGVGLVLLAAVSAIEPRWDKHLLMSWACPR